VRGAASGNEITSNKDMILPTPFFLQDASHSVSSLQLGFYPFGFAIGLPFQAFQDF
jgi:hypothetical protein